MTNAPTIQSLIDWFTVHRLPSTSSLTEVSANWVPIIFHHRTTTPSKQHDTYYTEVVLNTLAEQTGYEHRFGFGIRARSGFGYRHS